MTFEPVLPAVVLAVAAAAVLTLRAVAFPGAAKAGRSSLIRWTVTTVALALILLAAARPVSGPAATEAGQRPQDGANVYFVVDRSADSAITDYGGAQRISGMRDDIERLVDEHPGARFAVIAFASRPAVDWPLSADAWSLLPVVESLTPYPGSDVAEVNAGAAANTLRYQLISAGQQYPHAPNLVYYLGSGAAESTLPQGVFDTPPVDGGAVLGYGRGPGEDRLREIAGQLGVPYVSRGAGADLPAAASGEDTFAQVTAPAARRLEYYWALTMVAALLLLAEIFLTTRDLRRARATRREVLP